MQQDRTRGTNSLVIVRTFWTLGQFRCVLMRERRRLSVQVLINEQPFLIERSRDTAEAVDQAEALFTILSPAQTS